MDEQAASQTSAATSAAEPAKLLLIPDTWPGAWGAYKYSKEAVKRNWVILLVLILLSGVIQEALKRSFDQTGEFVGGVISVFLSVVAMAAYFVSVRGQKVSLSSLISDIPAITYLKYFVNVILLMLILVGSFLLLIVPFIIVLPRVMLAPYFVVDKKLGPIEAISKSWEVTKGHAGKVWGIIGATIAMALLCVTIIGIPFSLYFLFMYSAAYYVLYDFIGAKGSSATPVAGPIAPTAPEAAPVQ